MRWFMNKSIYIIIILMIVFSSLFGVDDKTKKRFEKAKVYKAKEVDIIKLDVMKPDIERYQKKTDTDITTGFYQLNKRSLRTTNRILLNKWLKESK